MPEYSPALVYSYSLPLCSGFYPWWGVGGPFIWFGVGFGVAPFFRFGWGWHAGGGNWGLGGGMRGGAAAQPCRDYARLLAYPLGGQAQTLTRYVRPAAGRKAE